MKNLFKTCVWQDKWVHPSESAWGLCHKFRMVNVLSGEEFRVLMKLPPYISYNIQVFNSDLALYCGRQFKNNKWKPYGNISLSNIINGDCLVNHQLYYCPKCIKDGFHSVYHQISYLDTCLFHPNQKLVRLCDCNYTYSLQSTISEKPFACPVCRKQMPIPENSGAILDRWMRPKEVVIADDLLLSKKNIEVIDIKRLSEKREVHSCITKEYHRDLYIIPSNSSHEQDYFKEFYDQLMTDYTEEQIYEILSNYRMHNYYRNEAELDIIAKIYFLYSIYEPDLTGLFMFREGRLRININEDNIMEQTLYLTLRNQPESVTYNIYKILSEGRIRIIKQLIQGMKYLGLNDTSIYANENMPVIVISKSDIPEDDIILHVFYKVGE